MYINSSTVYFASLLLFNARDSRCLSHSTNISPRYKQPIVPSTTHHTKNVFCVKWNCNPAILFPCIPKLHLMFWSHSKWHYISSICQIASSERVQQIRICTYRLSPRALAALIRSKSDWIWIIAVRPWIFPKNAVGSCPNRALYFLRCYQSFSNVPCISARRIIALRMTRANKNKFSLWKSFLWFATHANKPSPNRHTRIRKHAPSNQKTMSLVNAQNEFGETTTLQKRKLKRKCLKKCLNKVEHTGTFLMRGVCLFERAVWKIIRKHC